LSAKLIDFFSEISEKKTGTFEKKTRKETKKERNFFEKKSEKKTGKNQFFQKKKWCTTDFLRRSIF